LKRSLLPLILLPAFATAGSFEVWNGVDVELINTNRWFLKARGEVRSADAFTRFLTLRGTADARFSVAPHFALVSQFQAVEGKPRPNEWEETNRLGAGFELPFLRERFDFTSRTMMEHYWLPTGLSYDRWRERFALRFNAFPLRPQAGSEFFVDRQGWTATRIITGVLLPVNRRLSLDAGYYYEFRPFRQGGNRQVIYTYFRFRKPRT